MENNGYRPLANFEIRPGDLSLFLGDNGSGKSSVLSALSSLRRFATGRASLPECFSQSDLTAWLDVPELKIELEAAGNGCGPVYRCRSRESRASSSPSSMPAAPMGRSVASWASEPPVTSRPRESAQSSRSRSWSGVWPG